MKISCILKIPQSEHIKLRLRIFLLGILLLSLLFGVFFFLQDCPFSPSLLKKEYLTVQVEGDPMSPLIPSGSCIQIERHHTPQKGDIIIYEHASNKNFLIKRLMVTDTDVVEFSTTDTTI